MTGTAKTEEIELLETYNMRVIEIPTNKPIARIDLKDRVYSNKEAKYKAIVKGPIEIVEEIEGLLNINFKFSCKEVI